VSREVRGAGVTRWVLHVDLDQFLAAVEVLRHPELRGKPVVVGGDGDPSKRGVVATASYEARAHGVHSGLPLRTAARRCPDAVFLPVDREFYEGVSEEVMAALRGFGTVVEVWGWDEAFLAADTDDPEDLAHRIQHGVRAATRLECTVGIGENRLQAKLAGGFGKPAGVFRLTNATWFEVLGDRPADALWGVGAKTTKKLETLGIRTVAELAAADLHAMAANFGPTIGPWLVQTAHGLAPADVAQEPYRARSHGKEVTFQRDIEDWEVVRAEVAKLAGQVAADIEAEQRAAARVVVKVRYKTFFTATHGHSLTSPTTGAAPIEEAALVALGQFPSRRPVRLLGVRAEFAE
jgi:DNA polymerase-4